MSPGIVLYVALLVALAAALGWAMESLCRQFDRPTRWAWLAASMTVVALIARAALATPSEQAVVTYSRIALPAAGKVAAAAWSPLQLVRDAIALSATRIGSAVDAVVRTVPPRATMIALALWLATSLLALVVLAFVHLRIRRARRSWVEADLFGTRVRIAPDVGPAVVGMLRPQIVMPRWLLERSVDEQQLVLAHEREHLAAHDHLLLATGSLVVALVPWHPGAWWMLARLRLAIELDCDARVLRRGVPVRTYGTLLIDLADRCTGFRVGATALADEGSHLERRLLAMKTNSRKGSMMRAGMLGSAAGLALLVACEAKVPTGPEIEAMDVASASKAVVGTRMMQKTQMDSAIFYVDGKKVDAKAANSLTPSQIAAIDVNKGSGAQPVIRITTNPARSRSATDSVRISGSNVELEPGRAAIHERVAVSGPSGFTGIVYIDGVRRDGAALQSLDPKAISAIEVIKGAAAEQITSDPAAKNGIIRVTTKK